MLNFLPWTDKGVEVRKCCVGFMKLINDIGSCSCCIRTGYTRAVFGLDSKVVDGGIILNDCHL